ncbi:MAG: sigma-70 family RNA polymerase sigma factor [Deltaproteobacteria bacterium]|nr:sigma-70 family RNA polymerase sigma factor [Deltaproteobacteria bacterium]
MPDGNDIETTYRSFAPLVYRRCRMILANDQDCLDAVQEVFVRLARGSARFRGEADFRTWIYRVTTNHCLNRLRADRRRLRALERLEVREAYVSAGDSGLALERRRLLGQLLSVLGLDEVQLLVHVFCDGMTHAEVALVLGVTERTVRNRLTRAIGRARQEIDGLQSFEGGRGCG